MARFVIAYTPPQLAHAPRHWYVSPYDERSPIVVFTTQREAIDYARTLPQEYAGDGPFTFAAIPVSVQIDWIHANDREPLSFLISRTRKIIDRRNSTETPRQPSAVHDQQTPRTTPNHGDPDNVQSEPPFLQMPAVPGSLRYRDGTPDFPIVSTLLYSTGVYGAR